VRNIQTYNAPGPRVGTLASIYGGGGRGSGVGGWGLGGPPRQAIYAPIGLNISRFCAPSTSPRFRPSVFSILPRPSLPRRRGGDPPPRPAPDETAVALSRDAPFDCDCVPRVFVCHGAKLRDRSRRAVIYRRRRSPPPSKWARCARFTASRNSDGG